MAIPHKYSFTGGIMLIDYYLRTMKMVCCRMHRNLN